MGLGAQSEASAVAPAQARSRVLVIEDEPQLRKFVRVALATRGYQVLESETARGGLERAAEFRPELVLLDLGLPDMDGIAVIRTLRRAASVPIVVMSARDGNESKIDALNEGADEYLAKPFALSELLQSIHTLLRHSTLGAGALPATINLGRHAVLDLVNRVVLRNDDEAPLTSIEYRLLVALLERGGMIATERQLIEQVWGRASRAGAESLRLAMRQLRHKLEEQPARPRYLRQELGVGYRLVVDASP